MVRVFEAKDGSLQARQCWGPAILSRRPVAHQLFKEPGARCRLDPLAFRGEGIAGPAAQLIGALAPQRIGGNAVILMIHAEGRVQIRANDPSELDLSRPGEREVAPDQLRDKRFGRPAHRPLILTVFQASCRCCSGITSSVREACANCAHRYAIGGKVSG